jgi:Putative Ig domain
MRKLILLLLVLPLMVLAAPPAQAACTVTPQPPDQPITGTVGTEFTYFIDVSDCASSNKQPSFRVVDGRLPTGTKLFDFGSRTGLINGVPKTAGTFTFTVQVKDETRATDTATFTIVIEPAEAPTITSGEPGPGTVGDFYNFNLFATGGVQPYTWSVVAGTLPPGLELPRRDNQIFGTPTTSGTFTFTVRVTDDRGSFSERVFSITIT